MATGGAIVVGNGGQAHGGSGHGGVIGGGGGAVSTGGVVASGGDKRTGGTSGSGGQVKTGGTVGSGGSQSGGSRGSGGMATGGTWIVGGTIAATGGSLGHGGAVGTGGNVATGGTKASGGTPGAGGSAGGGTSGHGGQSGIGGSSARGGAGGATGGTCGNGLLDPGEACDAGAANADSPAFLVTQAGLSFTASPLVRAASCGEFYSYSSSSAHTGFEATGTSRIMLLVDKRSLRLSLVFFHGIDQDSSGVEQPSAKVQFLFTGLPDTTTLDVADETDEMLMTSTTTATGFWKFTNNTDGGALSTLPFPGDFEIVVAPSFVEGITTWAWVQSDGSLVGLDPSQPLTIKAASKHGTCRANCTEPSCGDGVLDAGEICDYGDGSGNGCALTCGSFN